jgi:hypothetical protein
VKTSERRSGPKTPLTQRHRHEAKGAPMPSIQQPHQPPHVCSGCGATIRSGQTHCMRCEAAFRAERMRRTAATGRLTANSPQARAKRSRTPSCRSRTRVESLRPTRVVDRPGLPRTGSAAPRNCERGTNGRGACDIDIVCSGYSRRAASAPSTALAGVRRTGRHVAIAANNCRSYGRASIRLGE